MFRSAATKLAHNSTIPALGANNDLRPLQDLILAEKQVLNSLQRLSSDLAKNAEALRIWGSGEGDDLGDILGASATLLALWASSLSQFSAHEYPMRDHLKAIRTREENLDDLKRRRKSVGAKAEAAEKKLSKMGPEHKNLTAQTDSLNALRAEIRSMDSEIMTEEAALGDFKRTTTRVWMGLKFGALLECSEKGTIAAEYGKLIIGEIVEEHTQPGMARSLYYGRHKTDQLLSEAHHCISEVVLSTISPNKNPQHALQQPEQQHMQPNDQMGLGMQDSTQLPVNTPLSTFQVPGLTSQKDWQPQPHPQLQLQPQAQQSQDTNNQYPHLPVHQGFGTGQFFEQPDPPASYFSNHQRYSSQSAQPNSPHQPIQEPAAPPPRSVDDFGITTNSSGLMDSPDQGAGSRFATFPVNHRSYNLADPQAPTGQDNESFSASVAQALSSSHGSPGTVPPQRLAYEVSPAQHSPQPQQGHSPVKGSGPSGYLSLHHETRSAYPDDEAGLAYDYPHDGAAAASPHDTIGVMPDVDPRLASRNGRSNDDAAHNPERQVNESRDNQHAVAPSPEVQPPEYEAIPPVAEAVSESHIPQSIPQPGDRSSMTDRFQHQRRVPPPVFDPAEEERTLNAAAAREVSREMDALTFNPPISHHEGERTHSNAPSNPGYGMQSNVPAGEQLGPPSASYSGAPSPNTDSPVLPYPSYNAPPTTDYPLPYPQGPTQQQPNRVSMDSQPATPRQSNEGPPRLPPLADQIASSPYSNPNTSSGEYRSLGVFPGPVPKPTSSVTASGPPGARTISAAAFKRPQRVDAPPTTSDVSPLSIRKRVPSARDGSPSRPGRSGSPAQPPAPPPSQVLPPVPKEDSNYDYTSAYVDSGVPQEVTAQRERKQSEYGDGKFATERSLG